MNARRRKRVVVFGNGGFGTALACHVLQCGHDTALWGHDPEYTARIAELRENPRYLPGVPIPEEIRLSSNAAELCANAELVLSVVPTQHLRSVFEKVSTDIPNAVPVLSCSKGMEQASGLLPTQILREQLKDSPLFVLSGPCHAEELARGKPASLVLAGSEQDLLEEIQADLAGPALRLYRSNDPLGVELGGALKNIIAIAAGIGDGLELGDNAKSALLTRGLAEIARFGVALGARRETFTGLAGMGDLITTSVSKHGRNRALGERLGRGETLSEILATTRKVAEGVWTCKAVLARAKDLGIQMPITQEVAGILFDEKPMKHAVSALMTRLLREEA